MDFRIGIDIGGTFTDLILVDQYGGVQLYKVSSTPHAPEEAVAEGVEMIAADLGLAVDHFLTRCELVVHGTTVVTNALIQGKGAKTGLLCTAGFRDSLEIRLGYKDERYGFDVPPPPILVPRYLRLAVPERVTKDGQIQRALDEDRVREHIATFRHEGVESVAVSFLWSFPRPEHERRVGELLAEELPAAYRALSVDILPQIREYDRTSTTVLSAFVGPLLKRYLIRIEDMLEERGFQGRLRFMQANSGFASAQSLVCHPINALNSGPAAAPMAGAFFGKRLGTENVVTVDMGGTSLDVCLVHDGLVDTVKNVDVCRYRVGIPMVNIHTIGAGGGSIAWLDSGGILRVGPRSAEAVPGPACYGRGGTEPTVTDANVILGYFNPRGLLGGRLKINRLAAETAVRTHIADPLGVSVEEASHGIFEVVNHNMTGGIREVSVERGHDPRDFALVVGGGAGAVHVGRLATALGVPSAVIPKIASAFCAFGQVVADLRHDYTASYAAQLRSLDLDRLNALYERMEEQAHAELADEGVDARNVNLTRWMDLRYVGQIHECTCTIPGTPVKSSMLPEIEELFHQRHESLYAYSERGGGSCELINVGVTARGRVASVDSPSLSADCGELDDSFVGTRPVYLAEEAGFVDVPVYSGKSTPARTIIAGPAIVEEETTTIVVYPGGRLQLDARGYYVMTFDAAADIRSSRSDEPAMSAGPRT